MSAALPKFIDPFFLAQQECALTGQVPLSAMPRIAKRLAGEGGMVYIDWLFCFDKQERPVIRGLLKAQLPLQCQRCLETVQWFAQIDVRLYLMPPGQTEEMDLENGCEALEIEYIPVSLAAMAEDELVLTLPLVARHEECPNNKYVIVEEQADETNPFHVLSQLKRSNSA
ncbi:MAG: hypothetical protein GY862_18840 [Gammaproteobacteria bacterium]|nr:hypothetical protein [Gammaproteobacteria bacterium]